MHKFIEQFEKAVDSSPIILSSHIEKQFGPSGTSLYIRGNIRFIDSTILEIALFASKSAHGIVVDKYRFHYMRAGEQMLFRYDNAPHHPGVASFPHHKHTTVKVIPSSMPALKDLLNEISAMMLRKQP